MNPDFSPLVFQILEQLPSLDADGLKELQRDFAKRNKMQTLPSKSQILSTYFELVKRKEVAENQLFETFLKKRAIRSSSGIVSVQVLTKPWPCPGRCIFCPNDPEMPKSYIKSEPGAMRAWLNQFDPVKQVRNRLQSLTLTGHKPEKIEMIVLGGSWDAYDREYQDAFMKGLYDACNTFSSLSFWPSSTLSSAQQHDGWIQRKYGFSILNEDQISFSDSLEEAIKRNETAKQRIIGLTIETRPDLVTFERCKRLRELGVTRIEMGVQSTDDEVLNLNHRGHLMREVRSALHLLRMFGFKISLHVMPGLYGSNFEKDVQTFRDLFSDPYLQPDELKIYPTSVIPNTELFRLYQEGRYSPITTDEIKKLVKKVFQEIIPPYTRIKRLIRDIPAPEIEAGSSITNLSQLIHEEMLKDAKQQVLSVQDDSGQEMDTPRTAIERFYARLGEGFDTKSFRNFVSLDTRSREIRNKTGKSWAPLSEHLSDDEAFLVERQYASSVGSEFFLSFEDRLGYLYGFTRLLLPTEWSIADIEGLGQHTAVIRELHVYGKQETLGKTRTMYETSMQHTWFGKKLLEAAEQKARDAEFQRLSVISGVGVREYYAKLWYHLEWTYMVKTL